MEVFKTVQENPRLRNRKSQNLWFAAQIGLRIMAAVATLAASCVVFTNKQTTMAFGTIRASASYTFSPAFKYFAFANVIGCSISSLFILMALILGPKAFEAKRSNFYVFLGDLTLTILLIAGCAAATAIGYVGRYGNKSTTWQANCSYLEKFCNKMTISVMLSYFGAILHVLLTVISAHNCTKCQYCEVEGN